MAVCLSDGETGKLLERLLVPRSSGKVALVSRLVDVGEGTAVILMWYQPDTARCVGVVTDPEQVDRERGLPAVPPTHL